MEFDATFLIAAISFVVFVFLMNKIFYAPILKIMQKRQNIVEQNYKSAKDTKTQTDEKTNFRNDELEKSRSEARLKISTETQKLKQKKAKEIAEYKQNLSENIMQERENLKNSALEAKEMLKDNIVDIAKEISLKLLGSSVDSTSINKSEIREEQG